MTMPFSRPSDLLEQVRMLLGGVAVVATVALLPIVVLGDRHDGGLARAFAVAGLLLTGCMQIRTYQRAASGRWGTVLAVAGLFAAATGLEHPGLVVLPLVTGLSFHALYASRRGTVALTAVYLVLYGLVVGFSAAFNGVPVELSGVTMVVLSLCLAATSWRLVLDALTKVVHSEARVHALLQHASDAVTVVAPDGTVLYDSTPIGPLLGYSTTERLGSNALEGVHPDDLEAVRSELAAAVADPGAVRRVESRYRHTDGGWRWIEVSLASMLHEPAVNGVVANYRDITDAKAMDDVLRHQALHDPLTGLANRQLFFDRLDRSLCRSPEEAGTVAVFFCDIDDFKTINDGISHGAGDAVLIALADRLAAITEPTGLAARLGGDEFAVLVDHVGDLGQAQQIGEELRAALRLPVDVDGRTLAVDATIGLALGTAATTADGLLAAADLAMHKAKREGKGHVETYDDVLRRDLADRLALRADLERAIAEDELEPFYQPIVELDTGRPVGFEALVRWRHPHRGVLPPAAFIGLAEETGLIVPIGSAVLRKACRDLAEWRRATGDDDLYVSVNASPLQLHQGDFLDEVRRALADAGLPADRLVLEVTETTLLEDTAVAATVLTQLCDMGVAVALDDFGTGYSSLTHLRRYPVAVVKIDRSFVTPVLDTPADRAVVQAVIDLADALGVHVVAEGIETGDHADALAAMGCASGQGYHFAKPLARDQLFALLGARRRQVEPAVA